MVRLDDILVGRPPLNFLKVETDGFDFEVLHGAEQTLRRDRPAMTIESMPGFHGEGEAINGLRYLQSIGYRRFHLLDPAGHCFLSTDDANEAHANFDQHVYGTYCDILTCAAGSPAEKRLGTHLVLRKGELPAVATSGGRRGPLGWFRRRG